MTLALHRNKHGAVEVELANEQRTLELGQHLARALRPGLVVYLSGALGTGKTTLVRGILRGLGYQGRVKSPTFALVEVHELSKLYLHHFDFYRFDSPTEWVEAGFREAFDGTNVCIIEWPEKAGDSLPRADLQIRLELAGTGRSASIVAGTETGYQCIEKISVD